MYVCVLYIYVCVCVIHMHHVHMRSCIRVSQPLAVSGHSVMTLMVGSVGSGPATPPSIAIGAFGPPATECQATGSTGKVITCDWPCQICQCQMWLTAQSFPKSRRRAVVNWTMSTSCHDQLHDRASLFRSDSAQTSCAWFSGTAHLCCFILEMASCQMCSDTCLDII